MQRDIEAAPIKKESSRQHENKPDTKSKENTSLGQSHNELDLDQSTPAMIYAYPEDRLPPWPGSLVSKYTQLQNGIIEQQPCKIQPNAASASAPTPKLAQEHTVTGIISTSAFPEIHQAPSGHDIKGDAQQIVSNFKLEAGAW